MYGLTLVPLLLACAPGPGGPRHAFVQDALVEDNRIWLTRDPELVARKFESMAADPYDFMRGSIALHFADLARPRTDRPPTDFLAYPEATAVMIVGDPHPENATLCHPEPDQAGGPSLEFVDLDAAGFGPWTLDVRRAALGLRTLATGLEGCNVRCSDEIVASMVMAYANRMEGISPPVEPRSSIVDDLIERAAKRGPEGRRITRLTDESPSGRRRFVHDTTTRLEPLSAEEDEILHEALIEWVETGLAGDSPRILDEARRFGSGISSQPALRFAVLWDGGEDGPDDDRLLQIREVIDPPSHPGRALEQVALFEDNAARVETIATALWSRSDADPRAAGLRAKGYDLKSMSWMDWLQPIDHLDIAEDWADAKVGTKDLAELGHALGHALAAGHARGQTAKGAKARLVIQQDLADGGGAVTLHDEILEQSNDDLERLLMDHAIFIELLETEGPLLGAENILGGLQ